MSLPITKKSGRDWFYTEKWKKQRTDQFSIPNRLAELGYKSYREYLESSHWQDLRKRYFASKMLKKCPCGRPGENLHHKTYKRLGNEWLMDVVLLCRLHHSEVHAYQKQMMENNTYEGLWRSTKLILRNMKW